MPEERLHRACFEYGPRALHSFITSRDKYAAEAHWSKVGRECSTVAWANTLDAFKYFDQINPLDKANLHSIVLVS